MAAANGTNYPDLRRQIEVGRLLFVYGTRCTILGCKQHNAQPVDSQRRLVFNSRWGDPFAAGVDMFCQSGGRSHSWVNAPFALLPRVLRLVISQRAKAAVIVPLGGSQQWLKHVQPVASGIRHRLVYDHEDPELRMVGVPTTTRYTNAYAVVFFDFATPSATHRPTNLKPAELLRAPLDRIAPLAYGNGRGWYC